MDYREEIAETGDVVRESIAVGSRAKYESDMVDSLFDKESAQIVGELEEKGGLRLNESGSLGASPSKHEEVGVFERPSFTNADRINGSFPEQELSSKVRELSDENQTVHEIDRTGENDQGSFPELSEVTSRFKEERNTKSIESCPPIPEAHHHPGNDTDEPSVEDGKITKIPVPEVLLGKDIGTEDVNEDAPVGVVEPNIEHETAIREKDDVTDAEEPEIITYRGRDLVEEGYHGNLPKVRLENENILQTEELKGKGHSVFVEESGVEGDGLKKAIPGDSQFTENYDIAEKKGKEIGIFSSNEDAQKPVTEGGDETDGQIEGNGEPQVREASFPEEKVDVEVPNEEVAPDILNVKDDSVDGLPSAKVSSLRDKIPNEDEILKTSNDDADEINFSDHEEDVQEDDVIGNDGLSKDRELTAIETATEETSLPAPGAPSNGNSTYHPENDFTGGKNEGSETDWTGITREITDPVTIKQDDALPDSTVYTEAIDGDLVNDPFSVPELTQDDFQPDIAEKEAPSGATASNEFNIAGEEDTSSGLTHSGDQTTKDYEEVRSHESSGEVIQEKAVEVSTVQADTVPGRDNNAEANSVKDGDTGSRKEDVTLESTDDAKTDDACDPIKREVPIVADSLGDFVQQETRVIPPEQENLTETSARSSVVENFAEERNASEEAISTLEDWPLYVPGASSEVKHESEESNISEEVHLHAGLSALTDGANEVSETQTANIPEVLAEEKLDVDQRSAELDAEISSAVPVDSNIDDQSASNEASNYEEASAAEAVVTESKIPDEEKILKKSFEQLKQDADEIDEEGKPTLTEGESERELDEVPDREEVLEDTKTSAGNVLNDTLEKSETEMNTNQPHDMADQGRLSHDQLASNEDPKYEESSAAEVVTNSKILDKKILARSFDGESEAQIGEDAYEVEKYEETAPGKGNSAREHDEVPAREEVPSVLEETIVDGMQQRDIANQTDIPLTEATVETTEKATVYDSAIDASTDNQRDISHFGTMSQDQELETNQKRDEPTNEDAASTLQDGTKIDTQTEETPDITLSETADEVASKIREDDRFGVAGELSENPIDGQSAFSEASNYEEASVAEAVVNESKIPEETATESQEQLGQDTDEVDDAQELDEVQSQEVLKATNTSAGNAPNEKFEQLETEVSGEQPHDIANQGDVALTEVPGEPIEKDGVDTTISLVDQKDGHGDDQLASNEDPKHESSVAEAVTESKILEEKILKRSFNDSLEAQIGQDADEVKKYRETALGEGNTTREHDEVPAREEVPSVLDETIVDGVQQQDIADQTDIALTEATVETTEKAAVYNSATDASTNDQRDVSHFGTLTQDQELETNKKQDGPTDADAASTCRDYAKIDTQTDVVASKIQEDDSFGVAGEVLENPIEESAIPPDETIKSEEISGQRQDVEEPALGQGDKGSSLVDDNIDENERGTVGSSEFMDAADSVQEIKEDSLQAEDVNEPLTGTGVTEGKDPSDIVEKDLIDGTESEEKIDAGEVASETKDISLGEVEQYEHVGESASRLQVGFSETPGREPSFDQTVVVDQTEEERKEIYDSNDRDGEIADPYVRQSSVNEAPAEQTKEEKAAEEVDSNIVSDTKTGITDTEPSQISRNVDTESFEERNSATENTENKEYLYEEGKYNIESKDRAEAVTRSEELADAKETSDESVFSYSELVESAVAEESILDQGIRTENSYERDSSLAPPEENEVKDQEVPLGAATDSFSERQEQDKEAREPHEEIPHLEQRDLLVDITEADYDRGTSSAIPADTQELSKLEGDIQKDEACTENKVEESENEGIRGLPPKDQQENAQGILAEEVALEGEITSKDVETDRIVQEDEKGNKEAENSGEANEDEINKDGEVDMGSSTINEESLATAAPVTEMVDLENKDSYTTVDNLHGEMIEGAKRDLNLSNEITDEGDSYSASADTPFSERSIRDTQPGMSSENLDGENAGELNAAAESVEDVIATEVSDETALLDTPNETTTTLQTQPTDHSYEQDSLESASADGLTIEFNRENEQDRQDKTSDEQSSQVEIDNPELGTDTPTKDVPATTENVEIYLTEMNEKTTGSSDVGEQKISEEAFFQVENSLPPEAEVGGIESSEVLQNEAETTEGGSAEEAPQLAHYTEISSDGPPDEMSAFSTSVPNDVQETEIREIVASEDDQTSRTIQVVSEHTDVDDGVASVDAEADLMKTTQPTQSTGNLEESTGETSVTVLPDENDGSNEDNFIVENQITSEQLLESIDQQIEPIPSREAVQEESDVVESAPVGESTLDENPLLRGSEKESESEGIQSSATKEAWSDGKELMLQTDISQDESDTGIPKYADKERDVIETEEITPLELGDRGFASTVQTKEILTDEEASKIKEVVSEDAGESIDDAIREVIPVTSDTQPSLSSENLDGETAGELNPTAVSVEDGAGEEEGTDACIEEASEALVDSKGHEEEATRQRELINVTEVSNEAALSDVPDETAATIQTVPADHLYERDSVELIEESKVHVESATADGSTIECYGNTEQDMEDKTSNEQTSQVEIDNRDLSADMQTRDVLATAENVEIDRAVFDEQTTGPSDIGEQTSTLVEEVERDQSRELNTSEEAFIQIDRDDISLPPEVEVEKGGSESNEVLLKEAETKEGGTVEEAPQFAHSMEIPLDGPFDQIPALSASVPDDVQEVKTPEIVTAEDDQTNKTILKELDNDSGNKVEQEDNAENEEKEFGIGHTQEYTLNEEKPPNGVSVEEIIASDQLTQEEESKDSRSGENIGEVIKDVYSNFGGVAAVDAVAGSAKPTEPTESTGNLENEIIGETSETVIPDEIDDSKEESFVEPIPHEEAVIAETEDVEPVSVGESTLDQSPLADVSREESTLLHARTEAKSDGNASTLQTDVRQAESDTSMSKFADKERYVQESEKITPLELGNRDFDSDVQTKEVLTEEDTSKIKEVVSEGADESVNDAIREVIPTTSDTQPTLSGEYLDCENVEELNSATVLVKDIAGKEESTDVGIEETSEALINSNGHEVEASGQRDLINATEVSDEAALPDAPNETVATIQTVPTADGSAMEFFGENEQEVQDKTLNEQASQVEIDNQDLAADMPTMDVPASVENVEIDQAELDVQTDGIGSSLPPEAETGGNKRNRVLQNQAETKEEFSGEEALQSAEISSDGPSDQMSAFSTSVPDTVREREIHKIVALEDDQTSRTIQEELDDESRNKVEQEDNAEKVVQEFTLNEVRPTNGESAEETISSDQLAQSGGEESNGSLGGENVSEVIKDVYADDDGVPAADAEADITKTTQPTQITGNLENEITGETSETVMPDEIDDSKEESFVEPIPLEEAVIAETEDVEPVSVGESTLDQSPLADVSREESTLLHARTEAKSDGNASTLQTDVLQDESDTSMSKFVDKERDVKESEKITPLELGNRDFASDVQTKEVLTEEDTSKIKEVVSEGADESVNDAIREVIPTTSDTQPSMSGEYLDRENVKELNSATVLVKDIAGKEESTDIGIEETSTALIDSNGHEVETSGQRDLINATEVSDEAALPDAPNETVATIQTVPTADGSAMEFYGENEQEVQDKTFNEQASQVEIDNQDLAADMPTMDVPASVENVKIDRAELDEQTDGIGSSLPPEAETGGNERNRVLQNQAETKEEFSGEEALQSAEISLDGLSDQMSAFSTSEPDAVREREIRKIAASEDDQTSRTIQEELDDESRNKVVQEDNAEKVEQEFTLNEVRPANGESIEETISSDQLAQSGGEESNGSLGGENVSEVIEDVYADVDGVPAADAEADITKTTQPAQITGNLEEESIEKMRATVIPDENYDSKEQSSFEAVPHEEARLVETEDVEPASVGESTLEQNPLSDVSRDEYTLLHAQTEAWPDENERMLQTDECQDESDTSMPKYAEKETDVPATGKITPLELGYGDFSSAVPTKEILTKEDASKNEEDESVDVAADHTEEQPSVTTEDTILKDKEVRDDPGHAAGKPEDMIETYEDKTSATASVINAKTTIPPGNEAAAEVGESVDDAIGELTLMTSDRSSIVTKEGEMIATETKHEKENASLEISQRNLTDTADLKDIDINEIAADIPSKDGQAATGGVSDLPQGSIDAITTASLDLESASLTLPSEETVADKAWTSRESLEDEHLELGFKETGTGDDTAKKSLDFTSVQADQETKNEINGGEILSDDYGADKADYGLASEAVEIADKVDPSLKEKEEKAFDEAQILQEKASREQDEYKQGDADEDKAPILSDANDPVEGTVDRSPLEEAEGQTFGSVEGDRKMETSVPKIQGSNEEIFEGDRTPALEESKGHNQVIASKEDAPTAYHDSVLLRDASLAKEVTVNLPGSTERELPPAEAREFRDQSEVNLDNKEFEEKFSADTTTVPKTPVVDNLQLPEQSPIIKPNEEHEDDDHEYIEHSDAAPLMVESSKDIVDGKARHKKSHNNLLSGMSSKVKSSISKVKKVITGKSSKEHSPKHGQ